METQLCNRSVCTYAKAYYIAKRAVLESGYADEVDWQYSVSLSSLDETTFLRETAWVILCSGMREKVIRTKFPYISEAFLHWKAAKEIVHNSGTCRREALFHFRSEQKIDAIISVANLIDLEGFDIVLEKLKNQGVEYLQQIPFIGPITSFHLAKNIGIPCAKPDRHLTRMASKLGYQDVQSFCTHIADATDEPITVVDLVLWRFSTLHQDYVDRFANSVLRIRESRKV